MEGGMIIVQDKQQLLQEEEEDDDDDDVPQLIVKGKRTKRHRPQSPIPDAILLHHQHNHDYNSNDYYYYYFSSSSPANSTTEEEEDTAKCLILLSQGPSPSPGGDEELGCKFSSKRYIETTAGNGRAGMYVYECKTCNRTFPSFQALGGHRASHKRPKHLQQQQQMMMTMTRPPMEDDEQQQEQLQSKHMMNNNNNGSTAVCVELGNNHSNNKVKGGCCNKVHECGICGAEFTSGQALGGHMRRHRNPAHPVNTAANTTLSLTPTNITPVPMPAVDFVYNEEKKKKKKQSSGGGFYLDLNLPASPEVEEAQFNAQTSNHQQQSPLVLSAAPTLVDCHY